MKNILLLLFFTLMISEIINGQTPPLETGVSQNLAKWRSANYSDIRYKLNITLEKGAPLMKGTIEISVKLTNEGAKNDLVLDWRTTQFQNDKDKPFAEVEKVNEQIVKETVPNGVFDYQTNKEHLIVSKKYLKTGENVLLIKFASPVKTSGAGVTRYVDKEDGAEYIYSLFVPSDASTAFPVFDQPDLKARFKLTIITKYDGEETWKVFSNTNFSRIYSSYYGGEGGYRYIHFEFEETKPISTYVFAFAAGDFAQFNEFPMGQDNVDVVEANKDELKEFRQKWGNETQPSKIYVRKSQAGKFKQHAAEVFRLNREGVKFLEGYFDYKFPFPKYDLVLIPEFPFGGMEHAGATFLREDRVIFPTEPTKNDLVTRANVIFHEAAHQWFGDTVTMKWFDDLWLKEGFAEFMAYKTLEKVMPEYNAWKIFYERNKQAAYLTDSTRGTTPIYQEIPNLSAAKSAYGNIVYRKAPSFLKQAEFYLGEKEFQIAVRAFLKKHEFANAEWTDLVKEFETASKKDLKDWANIWVKQRGMFLISKYTADKPKMGVKLFTLPIDPIIEIKATHILDKKNTKPNIRFKLLVIDLKNGRDIYDVLLKSKSQLVKIKRYNLIFPNYQDYGYGIFLLDEQSRAYVLENIQNEKDDFLRTMMWGSLWDSVRETELAPEDYVKLVIKNINTETDESTIQTLLGRVSTAMNYYINEGRSPRVSEGRSPRVSKGAATQAQSNAISNEQSNALAHARASAGDELAPEIEKLLISKIKTAPTVGQKITYFRALQSIGSGDATKQIFKDLLNGRSKLENVELKTKDKFDLVTRLIILGDKDALTILAELEKQNTDDSSKRYAYAAKAGIPTAENKEKYWNDFVNNREISESWIESAFAVWNTPRHSDLTFPYLEKALAELPNLKKNRKIFFVNGWLGSFIGGQKSEAALNTVNKFLAENPNLDADLQRKILENSDNLERAVKIRAAYGK